MKLTGRTIFIISADQAVARECTNELSASGGRYQTSMASSVVQAHRMFGSTPPAVIFLDETAIDPLREGESLESAVALLTETAPVVVAASPEKQASLAFLIIAGAVDFVTRTDHFVPIAAGILDRRVRMVERAAGMIQFPGEELTGDFGEILRHEVNNPLTGILGNTELLLSGRDRLPPPVIARLQTIAELAVRLRETVRRLSNACDEHYDHAHHA